MKRQQLGTVGAVIACCVLTWLLSSFDSHVDPSPGPAAGDVDRGHAAEPTQATGAAPSAEAKQEQGEASTSAPVVVREAVATPPTLEQQARTVLAQPPSSDVGVGTLRKSLQIALGAPSDPDPFLEPMPSLEFLQQSKDFNPARVVLGDADAKVVQALLAEYGSKLRLARRDEHLADRLSLIQAIGNGDFVIVPNGRPDPDNTERRVQEEARQKKPDGQWLSGVLPGSDFSHNRIVHLDSECYPLAFAAKEARLLLRSEFELAVRSVFLAASRQRR